MIDVNTEREAFIRFCISKRTEEGTYALLPERLRTKYQDDGWAFVDPQIDAMWNGWMSAARHRSSIDN